MSWIYSGIAGGTALLKIGEGALQNHQANSIDKNNPFPTYQIPGEYRHNLTQAENMAQTGMPTQAFNNQLNSINQNQAGAISALSNSANPGANLASIVRAGNSATNNLNAQDAMMRNQNMLRLLQERQILAQQKDKQWDWNSRQKYLGLLAKSNAIRGAGNANISSGLGELSGTANSAMQLGAFGNTPTFLPQQSFIGDTNLSGQFNNLS